MSIRSAGHLEKMKLEQLRPNGREAERTDLWFWLSRGTLWTVSPTDMAPRPVSWGAPRGCTREASSLL